MQDDVTISRSRPRRVTILDVASRAGVSKAAVSKVLRNAYGVSDSMRRRVEDAITDLDYRPNVAARSMSSGRSWTAGMIADDIQNPFISVVASSASHALGIDGYELFLSQTSGRVSAQHTIRAMIDRQMDGLILVGPGIGTNPLSALATEVPTVVIGAFEDDVPFDTVTGDDDAGVEKLIGHLVSLGHRRIAFIASKSGPSSDAHLPPEVRRRAYTRAITMRGLEPDIIESEWSIEGGRAAAAALLSRRVQPTAVFAGADVTAFGLLSALWEGGVRVPEEMSVVGFDDAPLSSLAPLSLTTVSQSGSKIGQLSAQLLTELIDGRTHPSHLTTQSELIIRRSTGPASVGSF